MRETEVLKGLDDYLSYPVIFAEQAGPKPSYPYISIKETMSFIPAGNQPFITDEDLPEDIKRTATSQPTMSLSITAYSDTLNDASDVAQQAHDWFTFGGYRLLKEAGLVVADIESVMNRDSLIVDDYERRRGFDVILRFVHSISRVVEEIKVVKGKVNDDPFLSKRSDLIE